jgi:hypothetical protein
MAEQPARPAFTGLLVHHDPTFGYALLVPDGWRRLQLSDSESGVFYAPDADDPFTGLAVDALDLGIPVTAEDLATLQGGLLRGLQRLSGCRVETCQAEAVGELLTLEARHTFRDGEATRKRWARLLYQGRTQVRLIAQGASVSVFEYWEPMFYEALRTVHFGSGW